MTSSTPAGWFADPHVAGQQRYWDGSAWTKHVAPILQAGQGQPTQWPPPGPAFAVAQPTATEHRRTWVLRHPVLSGLAALVLIGGVAGAIGGAGTDDPDTTSSQAAPAEVVDEPATDSGPTTPVAEAAVEPPPVDSDADGVADADDFLPQDPTVQTAYDVDTDGDGVADPDDDFPNDPEFSKDTDGDSVADRLDAFPDDAEFSKDTDSDGVADSVDAFPSDPSRSEITLAMENALSGAQDYLDYAAFSRQGLIDQLSSEYGSGFKVEDATWAVDQLTTNWREQAVRSAKDYLDYASFSRQGLISQLSSSYGSQYTLAEATYAVDQLGL